MGDRSLKRIGKKKYEHCDETNVGHKFFHVSLASTLRFSTSHTLHVTSKSLDHRTVKITQKNTRTQLKKKITCILHISQIYENPIHNPEFSTQRQVGNASKSNRR